MRHRHRAVKGEEVRHGEGCRVLLATLLRVEVEQLQAKAICLPSCGKWCVLGTLGKLENAFAYSLLFRLRFSPAGLDDCSVDDWFLGEAVTWPAGRPLEVSFGLDGLEEEYRRRCWGLGW